MKDSELTKADLIVMVCCLVIFLLVVTDLVFVQLPALSCKASASVNGTVEYRRKRRTSGASEDMPRKAVYRPASQEAAPEGASRSTACPSALTASVSGSRGGCPLSPLGARPEPCRQAARNQQT